MILGVSPDKDVLTIGEICRLIGIKPHVLRYWERAAGLVRPARRGSGHRRYTKKDVERLLQVRELVQSRGFTLEGVKKHLRLQAKQGLAQMALGFGETTAAVEALREIKTEIAALLKELKTASDEKRH